MRLDRKTRVPSTVAQFIPSPKAYLYQSVPLKSLGFFVVSIHFKRIASTVRFI